MAGRMFTGAIACATLLSLQAGAQSVTDMAVLRGLSPVTVLSKSEAGRAALGANYTVTGGIQTGELRQPTLWQFAEQQQLALRDVFITRGNLAQLADGLGTTLGAAYVARAHYVDRDTFTSISKPVADVIAYALAAARSSSNSGKYFFANLTTDGKKPVSDEARAIIEKNGGAADMFGKAYGFPAGSAGAGRYGDARPFQTEVSFARIVGRDYFGTPSDNTVYNRGPMMDLINSPSFPSGHTTYGYMGSLLLAVMVPERYGEMIARGAEYGNSRIMVGAHYAMDVLGGRALAYHDMAHLLANDPAYVGQVHKGAPQIGDFRGAVAKAREDVRKVLEAACGKPMAECAREDIGRFSDPAANEAFYASTHTYGLPTVFPRAAAAAVDVNRVAPEAGYLLTVAFPSLTLAQANGILTQTLGPGGGFIDDGSPFGVYSRINLYAASRQAAKVAATR
ncbi:MAG: phosphatase PAP2 family protein [Gemmatimonadaceae bacterium]|nr:phosphatase PAP2 family protein [Gemmatimonadaceae bacterium]